MSTAMSQPTVSLIDVASYLPGEPIPAEVLGTGATLRGREDPLGYDMSDAGAAIDRMVADVKSGRTRAAVEAELEGVRRAYNGLAR